MKSIILVLALTLISCSSKMSKKEAPPSQALTTSVAFEVTDGILHPESVLHSKVHKAIFVSNVASGNPTETKTVGYISKLSETGKVIKSKWVTGLKAPKGMAIVSDNLFVSDVNRVVKISISKGKILRIYDIKEATFLNDVVADEKGNIYISDMGDHVIYKLDAKGIKPWLRSPRLRHPNGLYTDGKEHLIVTMWGGPFDPKTFVAQEVGAVISISLKDSSREPSEETTLRGHLDGITADGEGNLLISDWISGDVYKMKKNGEASLVFNMGQGTADLSFSKDLNLLLIPQMGQNKIIGLKLK